MFSPIFEAAAKRQAAPARAPRANLGYRAGFVSSAGWLVGEGGDPPKPQRLIRKGPVVFRAILENEINWRRKAERWLFQIQQPPVSILDIVVCSVLGECRRKEPFRAARFEVANCVPDMSKRKMNKAIPAKDKIHPRQRISREIEDRETASGTLMISLVLRDQVRNDITATVIDACKIDFSHPAKVAAGEIKHRGDFVLVQ